MPRSRRFPCLPSVPSHPVRIRSIVAALALLAGSPLAAEVFTVGSGGTHKTLQSAVDSCPKDGCTIQLLDSVYKLPREVWIENKRNLTIERSAALRQAGIRPRLTPTSISPFQDAGTSANPTDPQRPAGWKRWPVTCKDSLGGSLDAKNPYSTTGYQYNGLVVVLSSQDVRVEGLTLDGGEPTTFLNKGIWDCKYDIFFGNVGLNLFHSARVVVRDSDLRNFFSAIYIRNRNPGGAVATPNSLDLADQSVVPFSRYGAMGDHLIERNEIHHNTWGVYDELEWDLGSTFRFNRIASNRNTSFAVLLNASTETNNMAGGFLYVKDVPQAIHRIHNNTIWGSPLVIGHGYFRFGVQHLFYNNIVGGFDKVHLDPKLGAMIRDDRQVLTRYGEWLDHNLFEIRDTTAIVKTQTLASIGSVTDSGLCATNAMAAPCWLQLDSSIQVKTVQYWPWPSWKVAGNGTIRGKVGGTPVEVAHASASELFPGGGRLQTFHSGSTTYQVTDADNLWAYAIPWKSTTQGAPGFLEPEWSDSLSFHAVRGNAARSSGWTNASTLPDRGAISSTGTYPVIWALRSQEPVFKGSNHCYSIRLTTHSGGTPAPARIASVDAWSTPVQSALNSDIAPARRLRIRPLPDSSFQDGQWHTFCLDSLPTTGMGLRFHVGLSRPNGTGSDFSETAYFLLADPTVNLIPSSAKGLRHGSTVRISWKRGELVLQGLEAGSARVSLHDLEGRRISAWEATPQAGRLSLPLRRAPEGTAIVVVDQEGRRTSARVIGMSAR